MAINQISRGQKFFLPRCAAAKVGRHFQHAFEFCAAFAVRTSLISVLQLRWFIPGVSVVDVFEDEPLQFLRVRRQHDPAALFVSGFFAQHDVPDFSGMFL
jgi:hypothetical protein